MRALREVVSVMLDAYSSILDTVSSARCQAHGDRCRSLDSLRSLGMTAERRRGAVS
jgi:hypothetical protein